MKTWFHTPSIHSSSPLLSRLLINGFSSALPLSRTLHFSPVVMASTASQSSQTLDSGDASGGSDVYQLIHAHQAAAARLSPIEEARTLLNYSSRGVLSTLSKDHEGYPSGSMVDFACDDDGSPILAVSSLAVHAKDHEGYPSGSMVDFACDDDGSPILAVSSLAVHAKNLLGNPKCSLLVTKDPQDRTDVVITLHGDAISVSEKDREAVRSAYLRKLPDAFWVDFGDFHFIHIRPKFVRYVTGVATALLGSGEFGAEEFKAAKVDPIFQFSAAITSHMNKDHEEDTKAIVQYSTSVKVDSAYMLDVDSLGFNVKAGYQGSTLKLRIPFPRRAEDRKDVKTLIVEMLQAARASS